MNSKKRLSGIDLVRCICALFVVMEHFFLNTGYYDQPLSGGVMFTQSLFRWLFLVCIPMFMMLTGYFKLYKGIDRAHYMSIIPLAISYVVISIPKMLLYNHLYGSIYSLKEGLKSLGNYSLAWYAGFYIAFMLLVPFLNKLWNSLYGKKEQLALIFTLAILCSIYPLFNYVVPSFFINLYPVMYYFIGIYIRENQVKLNKLLLAAIAIIAVLVETLISFFGARGGVFNWNIVSTVDTGFGGLFIAISSISVFLLLYNIDIKSKIICKVLSLIGSVTFETYLFAGAYDAIIYGYLKRSVSGAIEFWKYFPAAPLLSFLLAVISAIIYKKIYVIIASCFKRKNDL